MAGKIIQNESWLDMAYVWEAKKITSVQAEELGSAVFLLFADSLIE